MAMKIKYLGTAAYEGVPAMFCNCPVCKKAMKQGGRNLRSRSQALINDDLLIDFPADTVWHFQRFGFDWSKITDCIITHSHCDHLYPDDVTMAEPMYSHEHRPLHFHAAKSGYEKLYPVVNSWAMGERASVSLIEVGKRFCVGENGKYSVLPLPANHAPETSPVLFSITCEGKRMLYAHDTGVFPEETWEGMRKEGRYDLVSLDCTGCVGLTEEWRNGHMSIKTNREMLEQMRKEGLIDENTVVVISHFSHNGGQTYDEMCPEAEKDGIIVAYDGLEVAF